MRRAKYLGRAQHAVPLRKQKRNSLLVRKKTAWFPSRIRAGGPKLAPGREMKWELRKTGWRAIFCGQGETHLIEGHRRQ
jgi:hypothetical protein